MDELWSECDILREDDVLQFPEFLPQNIFMVQLAANCISEDISLLNGKQHYRVILENTVILSALCVGLHADGC